MTFFDDTGLPYGAQFVWRGKEAQEGQPGLGLDVNPALKRRKQREEQVAQPPQAAYVIPRVLAATPNRQADVHVDLAFGIDQSQTRPGARQFAERPGVCTSRKFACVIIANGKVASRPGDRAPPSPRPTQ